MAMAPAGSSTAPEDVPQSRVRRSRTFRRAYLTVVGAFLVLGMLNVFGSRTSSVSAVANGYSLRVEYPAATRSSLPVKWQVVVSHAGGFAGPVRIGVPFDYWGMFDFNNFYPIPESTLNQGDLVILTFPKPAGDTLEVLLDARSQPGLKLGMGTTTAVLGNDNRPLVQVSYHTSVAP
jgi:hypothetical protein